MTHPDYLDTQDHIEVIAGKHDGLTGIVVRDWFHVDRHTFPVTHRLYGVLLYDGRYAEIRRCDMRKIGAFA